MNKQSFNYPILFLCLIFPLCIFLSFNKHSKDKNNSYHSVIWADAAGYYVYLPNTFLYDSPKDYPDSISKRTGFGFTLDSLTNTVRTKYYCGVAILQSPFFFLSHIAAKAFNQPADGFSKIYQWGIMIAAIFYSCIGMYLISLFLMRYYSKLFSFLIVLVIFLSTNLYYYSIDAVGMSHIYSFFLIAALMVFTQRIYDSYSLSRLILLSITYALIVLVRPVNGIVIFFFLFFDVNTRAHLIQRVTFLRSHFIHFILASIIFLLCFIPQMLYWKSISGNWLYDSYPGESFIYLTSPQLLKEWFSTNNGFFTYAPVMMLSIAGMMKMIRTKTANGILILTLFLLASYILASWWSWWYGCSYGARSFVEFYPLLIIPVAYLLSSEKNKWRTNLFWTFIVLCAVINFNIIYYYDGCYYGGDWDWNSYVHLHLKKWIPLAQLK